MKKDDSKWKKHSRCKAQVGRQPQLAQLRRHLPFVLKEAHRPRKGAQRAHRGPVVAQAAGEFAQHGVVVDGAVNAGQVIGHRGQVAAGQLRTQGAGVEQGRAGVREPALAAGVGGLAGRQL